jgi:diguanylate cyclase (GGDEF)-like protein/PAS domain S-box-containing protein
VENGFLEVAVAVSLLLQLAATVLALNLIRVTGRRLTWLLLGLAAAGLATERALAAYRVFGQERYPESVAEAILALAVAALLLASVASLGPLSRASQQAVAELRQSGEQYRRMVDQAGNGIWLLDSQGKTIFANARLAQMLGYPYGELLGSSLFQHVDARFRAEAEMHFRRHCLGAQEQFDFRFRRHDGSYFWAIFSANLLVDDEGRFLGALGIVTDITDRMMPERLLRLSQHDPLTGLPNRTLLSDRLTQALAQAHRYQKKVGVLFVDLDRFKPINDAGGHRVGDGVLREVALRLSSHVRQVDTVARYGGDEFAIVLQNLSDRAEAERIAQGIVELLGRPVAVEGKVWQLGASIGISLYPDDGGDGESLLRSADAAMYLAKQAGGGCLRFFTAGGGGPASGVPVRPV